MIGAATLGDLATLFGHMLLMSLFSVGGALVMLAGFLLPTTALAYAGLSLVAGRHDGRPGHAFKAAMAPLVVAMMLSSGWILGTQTAGWLHVALMAIAAALTVFTRMHVLVLIGAGAAIGAFGWL
jgi:chromate transporter